MKWIKLFENFDSKNSQEILDLVEDIKSVLYIIEDVDDSYVIKLKYYVKEWDDKYDRQSYNRYDCSNGLVTLKGRKDKLVGILIEIYPMENMFSRWFDKEKFDNDVSKFFSLLKEHLDYLSSNNHILTNGNGQGMSSILISFPVQVKTNDAPIKIY
jgi:hypothetical protein